MTANPADIARALSEAQREAVFAPNGYHDPNTIRSLRNKGIIQNCRLTDFGVQVRDYLLHRPTIDASTDRNQAKVVRCGKEIE
jgi:hypothetical protein